ncbi:elongation factor P [bacterium]|nr:elongation factor P [bacterium]
MYETSDIRKNLKIQLDGDPYIVIDFQFVKPGKGVAFTRTKLKNMITGNVLDRTFRSGEKIEPASLEEHPMQFLYSSDNVYHFMDTETYEQIEIDKDHLGDAKDYLVENLKVEVLLYKGQSIGINLPNFVELQVVKTEPGVKGDTVSGANKPAIMHTGAKISVPIFINEGEWILVDTRTGQYTERVKK